MYLVAPAARLIVQGTESSRGDYSPSRWEKKERKVSEESKLGYHVVHAVVLTEKKKYMS